MLNPIGHAYKLLYCAWIIGTGISIGLIRYNYMSHGGIDIFLAFILILIPAAAWILLLLAEVPNALLKASVAAILAGILALSFAQILYTIIK